ncbi:MAG: HPr kinase/phosphorylase [Sulfitobacter sp.]|jgi:HPr kinase/phosphorylase
MFTPSSEILHATTVSVQGRAVLIVGPAGSGKSALALQLIALGARLVSDDRSIVTRTDTGIAVSAPDAIKGMIEARGVGILKIEPVATATLCLTVDMGQSSTERLPDPQVLQVLGQAMPCLHRVEGPHFAAAVLFSLKGAIGLLA